MYVIPIMKNIHNLCNLLAHINYQKIIKKNMLVYFSFNLKNIEKK